MKAEIKSVWNDNKHRPNIYITLTPENDAEKAAVLALYSVRGKVDVFTDGSMMIDFYPEGGKK